MRLELVFELLCISIPMMLISLRLLRRLADLSEQASGRRSDMKTLFCMGTPPDAEVASPENMDILHLNGRIIPRLVDFAWRGFFRLLRLANDVWTTPTKG